MKKFKWLYLVFAVIFIFNINVNAEINIIDESESTRTAEKREREEADDNSNSNLRAGLTVPKEGDYNKEVDKYNSSGRLTQRNFYKGSVLRQISYFTYDSKLAIYKLTKKVLYWSNGKTIERERFYSYSGKTIYNTQTKRYYDNAKLNWHLYYDGSTGKNKEWRYYDTTGTYYTSKGYYKNGILNSREYWKGSSGNYIVEYGLFNSTGEHWTKLTRYYNSAKAISEVINYTGAKENKRKDATGYRLDGSKEWYRTYTAQGDNYHLTYYGTNGVKTREARYLDGTSVWQWDIIYQANGVDRESVRYRNEENIYTKSLHYYGSGNKIKYEIEYDEEGEKSYAKCFDEETSKLIKEEWYSEGIIDVIEYYDLDGKTVRKIRYFKDGVHLRWDINYVNGEKESVKLYDNKLNYELKEIYTYKESDKKLDEELNDKKNESNDSTLSAIFNNEAFIMYIYKEIDISRDSHVYIEDFKNITKIRIDDGEKLADSYTELKNGETFIEEIYDEVDEEDRDEIEKNNSETEIISDAKTEFSSIEGIHFFTDLNELYINNSTLSSIPTSIGKLEKLNTISVTNSKLANIPNEISELNNLIKIDFSNNILTSTADYFMNLNSLKELNLSGNNDILFISKDLFNLQKDGQLEKVVMDQEYLRIRGTDVEDIELITRNTLLLQNGLNKLKIKDEINTKIYKEDKGLSFKEIIIPEITHRIVSKEVDTIKYTINYVDKNSDYEVNKVQGDRIDDGVLKSDSLNNELFKRNGTYVVLLSGDVKNISFSQTIVVRVYEETSAEILKNLEKNSNLESKINGDGGLDETNVIDMSANMDDTDTVISQTEKNVIEEQSEAYEKLEKIQEEYDLINMEGYAGAYFDDENKINVLFSNTGNLRKLTSKRSADEQEDIIFKMVKNSNIELEQYKNNIEREFFNEVPGLIYIDVINNGIVIEVEESNIERAKDIVQNSNLGKHLSINIEYKIINSILPSEPTAKVKLKAGTYIHGYDTKDKGYFSASIGYRAYKKCIYTKKNKKGKIIKSARRCNGYTTAAHLELRRGASVWQNNSRKKVVGTANKMSRQTDTRFITLNTKNAYTPKKLRSEKAYHYVFSQNKNNDILVEGMIVTKVYRSIYSNAKWVSGKLTNKSRTNYMTGYYLDKSKGGVQLVKGGKYFYPFKDTMEAKIACVGGDSGGPLVRLAQLKGYKSKKYHIIGTTMSSDSDGFTQFSKVSRSQSYLGITAY